jgi:hypothetical protein
MTGAKLKELEARATEAPWKLIKHSDGQHMWGEVWATERDEDYQVIHEQWNSYNAELVAYLRNHAQDFIRLMEAAEATLKMYDAPDSAGSSLNYYASLQELRQSLAAFKEKS